MTERTKNGYEAAIEDFSVFLANRANEPIQYITTREISTWRDGIAGRTSATTANNKLKILRVFFESAWRENLLLDNPAAKVPILKAAESIRRPFTLDELRAVIEAASFEWKGIILFGFYTGQRLKDISSLTWANIAIDRQLISLSTSKTGRRQIIPIAIPLSDYLQELPSTDDPRAPIFPSAYKIVTSNRDTSPLSQQFHTILVDSGLAAHRPYMRNGTGTGRSASRERNELSFHSLRHSATSYLKNAGVSEATTRDLIGHQSAEISMHYTLRAIRWAAHAKLCRLVWASCFFALASGICIGWVTVGSLYGENGRAQQFLPWRQYDLSAKVATHALELHEKGPTSVSVPELERIRQHVAAFAHHYNPVIRWIFSAGYFVVLVLSLTALWRFSVRCAEFIAGSVSEAPRALFMVLAGVAIVLIRFAVLSYTLGFLALAVEPSFWPYILFIPRLLHDAGTLGGELAAGGFSAWSLISWIMHADWEIWLAKVAALPLLFTAYALLLAAVIAVLPKRVRLLLVPILRTAQKIIVKAAELAD